MKIPAAMTKEYSTKVDAIDVCPGMNKLAIESIEKP